MTFSLNYPHSEFTTGRALRTSPIFPKLQLAGAQFGQVMGYEKPMYFKAKKPQSLDMGLMGIDAAEEAAASQGETLKLPIAKTETFYRPPWFQAAAEEFQVKSDTFYLKISTFSSGHQGGSQSLRLLQLCQDGPLVCRGRGGQVPPADVQQRYRRAGRAHRHHGDAEQVGRIRE